MIIVFNPDVEWRRLLILAAIAASGIFVGSSLSAKVPEVKLKKGFGWFVLVMGSFILIQQISKL